jgi:hypothetical protein
VYDFRLLLSETRIPIAKAAEDLGVSVETVKRAATLGTLVTRPDGSRGRIPLEAFKMFGRQFTTREAIGRYVAAINSPAPTGPDGDGSGTRAATSVPGRRTQAQRREAARRADELAQSLGC